MNAVERSAYPLLAQLRDAFSVPSASELALVELYADRQISLSDYADDADALLGEMRKTVSTIEVQLDGMVDVKEVLAVYTLARKLVKLAHRSIEAECNAGPDAEAQ